MTASIADPDAVVEAAESLLNQGRAEAAVALLSPLARTDGADHPVLATCATARL